jgi:RNA polymerase sigma factor (sigma-70 family)
LLTAGEAPAAWSLSLQARRAPSRSHELRQPVLVHRDLELFLAVDAHDGDPDRVVLQESVVALDVDLVERERMTRAHREDRVARVVAEVAPGPRIENDPAHGRMVAVWEDTPVREGDLEDLELQRRLAQGDSDAFDALYRRYAGTAYGLAYRLVGAQLLAQDVVHDAFLALWRAPEAYDPARGPFRTFFLSLVHHRAVDTIRREERLRARTDRAANLEPSVVEDVADAVAEEAFLGVRRKEVREALADLPPEQRQVLEMAYFGGRTQVQIANELTIPLGTVKTRTLAALRKLRKVLEDNE